jgi:hypothetical protein
LKADTVTKIIKPGKIANHQEAVLERACCRTLPQVTTVGGTPNPKKERALSNRMALTMPKAA